MQPGRLLTRVQPARAAGRTEQDRGYALPVPKAMRDPQVAPDHRRRLVDLALYQQRDAEGSLQEIDEVVGPEFGRDGDRLVQVGAAPAGLAFEHLPGGT